MLYEQLLIRGLDNTIVTVFDFQMIADKSKKIAIVTGATGGIGTQLCKSLIEKEYYVLALCRNSKNGTQNRIPGVEYISGSLDNYGTVGSFVGKIINTLQGRTIEILFNNAGIIAPDFRLNENGIESSLFVNCVAPVILTQRLLPYFTPRNGRIVNTLSCTIDEMTAKRRIGSFDFDKIVRNCEENQIMGVFKEITDSLGLNRKEGFVSLKNYSMTKRLLAFYTSFLLKSYLHDSKMPIALGADPGVVNTGIITQHRWYDPLADIFFRPFIKSPSKGSIPLLRAASYMADEGSAEYRKVCSMANPLIIFKGKYKTCTKEL